MPFLDKEKQRQASAKWYRENRERQKKNVKRRQQALRQQFTAYKQTKRCLHCGESDYVCLEFHHIDPRTKDVEPSQMINNKGWSFEKVISHLEQCCITLCSNCHKKVHRDLKEFQRKLDESTPHTTPR